ncbi:hypothetical protein CROQUDRAFT_662369 [Cronartium quercuum f. sp. fusiforme G11]|uniref:Uncharacterized protein n=1 Tax=Cronartium quercuum f. sp. fusiforme G11 TaxID=708437 RepID=A0A9P6T830_9BASI|nr:hypothetical protein CROQUDRAFT_662369 [Cronartium quercuum f. sp. fusiforme G11]
MGSLGAWCQTILCSKKYFGWLAALILLGDTVLTGLIMRYVPCQYGSGLLLPSSETEGLIQAHDGLKS